MRRLAWCTLSGCLIAVLGACTSTTAAAPSRTPPAPVAAVSATTGARPAASPSATAQSAAAVVTGYYRAVAGRNYRTAFGYLGPGATGPDGGRLTLSSFLQLAHMLDAMGGPVTRFSIGVSPPEVVMTNYRVRYGPYHAHLRVARTKHGWTISSIDRI